MLHVCADVCVILNFLFACGLFRVAALTLLIVLISDFCTYIELLRGLHKQMQLENSASSSNDKKTTAHVQSIVAMPSLATLTSREPQHVNMDIDKKTVGYR